MHAIWTWTRCTHAHRCNPAEAPEQDEQSELTPTRGAGAPEATSKSQSDDDVINNTQPFLRLALTLSGHIEAPEGEDESAEKVQLSFKVSIPEFGGGWRQLDEASFISGLMPGPAHKVVEATSARSC